MIPLYNLKTSDWTQWSTPDPYSLVGRPIPLHCPSPPVNQTNNNHLTHLSPTVSTYFTEIKDSSVPNRFEISNTMGFINRRELYTHWLWSFIVYGWIHWLYKHLCNLCPYSISIAFEAPLYIFQWFHSLTRLELYSLWFYPLTIYRALFSMVLSYGYRLFKKPYM